LLKPFEEWTDDGTRVMPGFEERMDFYLDLRDFLIANNRNFVEIDAKMNEHYGNPNWYQRSQDARIAVQHMFDKLKKA